MARKDDDFPYPTSPKNVPEDLALASPTFMLQATILLITSFLFLLLYIAMMAGCVYLLYWGLTGKPEFLFGRIMAMPFALLIFLVLLKGCMTRNSIDDQDKVEVKEKDHPKLYDFIDQLCQEVGAPFPEHIYALPDVNAAIGGRISMLNLFVPMKRDLYIGLGLVNCVNLSEFKAIMAHELGHYAQSSFIDSYSRIVIRIILGIVKGRDWLDRILERGKNSKNGNAHAFFAVAYYTVYGLRMSLYGIFRVLVFLDLNIGRQREFNADLCGVRVAGSDAMVHGLKRTEFGQETLMQAWRDLQDAADHRMYTADLYFHQARAAEYLRKIRKDPTLGKAPELKSPTDGKKIQVFDPHDDSHAPMWDEHPSLFDREENAKQIFVAAPLDERTPWVLFDQAEELKEKVTFRLYRKSLSVPKNVDLVEPEKVQQFIDDEHAELTYDERYHGVYDDRAIRPGELDEILEMIEKEPWDDERLERVEAKMYQGLNKRGEDYREARKEYNRLMRDCQYKPQGKTKRIVEDLRAELDEHYDWFKSFDRRVCLVYMQMGKRLPERTIYKELLSRYRFHLPLIKMHLELSEQFDEADAYANVLFNSGSDNLGSDFFPQLMHVLRKSRKALKIMLRDARDLDVPMLKNFTGEEALDEFLLDQNLVAELPEQFVRGDWIIKLMNQMSQVLKKTNRLHFKSMGNILSLQEQIAKEFKAMQPPAAILEDEDDANIPEAIVEDDKE